MRAEPAAQPGPRRSGADGSRPPAPQVDFAMEKMGSTVAQQGELFTLDTRVGTANVKMNELYANSGAPGQQSPLQVRVELKYLQPGIAPLELSFLVWDEQTTKVKVDRLNLNVDCTVDCTNTAKCMTFLTALVWGIVAVMLAACTVATCGVCTICCASCSCLLGCAGWIWAMIFALGSLTFVFDASLIDAEALVTFSAVDGKPAVSVHGAYAGFDLRRLSLSPIPGEDGVYENRVQPMLQVSGTYGMAWHGMA